MSKKDDEEVFMERMKDALFEKHKERKDGMIEAEVCDEIYDLIMKKVPQDKAMNQIEFNAILIEISVDVANYLIEQIEELPPKLASSFAFDFVSQLLMSAATISSDDKDHDVMFG